MAATEQGGRWLTTRVLGEDESAQVTTGDVKDEHGNTNESSNVLSKNELPPDTDGDGTFDEDDSCPNVPGPPSNQGCPIEPPPVGDGDGDGVPDAADDCPDEPGPINRSAAPCPRHRPRATARPGAMGPAAATS